MPQNEAKIAQGHSASPVALVFERSRNILAFLGILRQPNVDADTENLRSEFVSEYLALPESLFHTEAPTQFQTFINKYQ